MFAFLLLFDSSRHPRQFPPRAFDLELRLFLLLARHLRQRFGQSPPGPMQNRNRHLEIALHLFHRRRLGWWCLPLRFQKQFRLGENAFADRTRSFAPGRVELAGLPRIATVLDEGGRHARAIVRVDSRHRHQILHRHLRRELSFAHLVLNRFRQ